MALAVVTGAASGIGRALADALGDRGFEVVRADLPDHDVADPAAMDALAAGAASTSFLCLNAGMTGAAMGPPWEATPEEWRRVLDVNVGGIVNGLRAFVPGLLALGEPAKVLITASLAGLATWPGGGAYAASKHAAVAVAEQAAMALAGTNVTVTLLCPALVRSGMSPIGVEPEEVAAEALAAVDAGRFLVVPDEWRGAIERRTDRLLSGSPPDVPEP